jgi:hypothetical protein
MLAAPAEEKAPGEIVFNLQNPTGWPAVAGHDTEIGCTDWATIDYSRSDDAQNRSRASPRETARDNLEPQRLA